MKQVDTTPGGVAIIEKERPHGSTFHRLYSLQWEPFPAPASREMPSALAVIGHHVASGRWRACTGHCDVLYNGESEEEARGWALRWVRGELTEDECHERHEQLFPFRD